MYTYQKTRRFFAQHAEGLESVVVEELRELGVGNVEPSYLGVFFETDHAGLYRVNYRSQTISRVLAPIITFDCHSDRYLYKTARNIDWSDFMAVDTTFAVYATVSHSKITHSQYAALRLKDAIVDFFRDRYGKRPDVDTVNPDVSFNLHIRGNRAAISLDISGGSLHRRGYRTAPVETPMQETLAGAIIRLSGWDGSRPLYDPMCGSGTLLCEALIRYCRIPAGMFKPQFGLANLPDFDLALWLQGRREADAGIQPLPDGLIAGSDISAAAVAAARTNIGNLPGGSSVRVERQDFRSLPGLEGRIIVCNPPYGIRSGNKGERLFGTR